MMWLLVPRSIVGGLKLAGYVRASGFVPALAQYLPYIEDAPWNRMVAGLLQWAVVVILFQFI